MSVRPSHYIDLLESAVMLRLDEVVDSLYSEAGVKLNLYWLTKARPTMAERYCENHEYENARRMLEEAKAEVKTVEVLEGFGRYYTSIGRYDSAEIFLKKAISMTGTLEEKAGVTFTLCELYLQIGDSAKVAEILHRLRLEGGGSKSLNDEIERWCRKRGLTGMLAEIAEGGDVGMRFLEAARKYLGVPFAWNGRSKEKLDCMGLLFLAYSDVTGKPWRELSVLPSVLVKSGKLGNPVPGLDGVLRDSLKNIKLKKGDILYFLSSEKVYETDIPLVRIDSIPYWVWHMGIYAGYDEKPMVLHACPSDRVKIEPLENIYFDAIFVTRFGVTDSVENLK